MILKTIFTLVVFYIGFSVGNPEVGTALLEVSLNAIHDNTIGLFN